MKKIGRSDPKKIGLALGGGGARGLAHVGVLKVLDKENIPISCIAGTSMGGVIGALYAGGVPITDIETEVHRIGRLKELVKLVDLGLSTNGLLKGTRVYNLLAEKLGADLTFANMPIPLALVAVDVNSGLEMILKEGAVVDAVRATISVPGAFAPVEAGDCLLVDGGILNNVPVDVVQGLGAQAVIAVDVLPGFGANQPCQPPVVQPLSFRRLPQFAQQTWQVQMIMISALTEFRLKETRPDVIIRPDLPKDMGLFVGFDRPGEAIAAGEAAAEGALPQIRALLQN